MSQSSAIAASSEGELASPEGIQEGNSISQGEAIRLQLLFIVSPEKSRCENTEMHMKGMISASPDSCIIPYTVVQLLSLVL